MNRIAISLVLYKNNTTDIISLLHSLSKLKSRIHIIDNSPYRVLNLNNDSEINYAHNPTNPGYGAAHNIALKKSLELDTRYHLVINPDINFEPEIIEELLGYMETNADVGLVMPKVLNADGSVQKLCKLLPSPIDLFFRRFLPNLSISKKRNNKYELETFDYNSILNSPSLSGCFMLIRTSVLKEVGLFDERYFMYLEDYDLVRRIHKVSKTIFYPHVSVFHGHEKGSYKSLKLLFIHMASAVKYFNKWGWFFDEQRERFNKATMERLESSNK